MRVLFVSTRYPRDLRTYVTGTFQRMRMFIEAVKEIAHFDLLFYVASDVDISASAVRAMERELCRRWNADIRLFLSRRSQVAKNLSKWDYYFAGAISFFWQRGASTSQREQISAFENCLELKPDLVFIHRLASMCPPLLTRKTVPPILFDLDDVEHVTFLRGIEKKWPWPYKLLQYSRLPALLWAELRAIRLARRTFVCSDADRQYLARRWKLRGVVTIPNSVMRTKYLPVTSEPTVLFLGTYGYKPNAEAADFLISEIWPHILRAVPCARLIIAGSRPEQISAYSTAVPGVEFPGFVDDLESLYRRSRVVCCPILGGGGTRIKIIEAAAYGKPIVATSIGGEGLHMQDGRELLIRDNPDSFARACIDLLKDAALCERLGTTAYQTAISRYNRATIVQLIRNYINEAAQPQTVREDKTAQGMLKSPI